MSLYVLDTDILSLFRHGHTRVCQRVLGCGIADLAATVISVEEQLSGWYTALRRARQPRDLAQVYEQISETVRFFGCLQIISFSESAIAIYEGLKGQKLNIGRMDLRIAAIVLEHDACLVTRNVRDFGRIPGLQIEDWTV